MTAAGAAAGGRPRGHDGGLGGGERGNIRSIKGGCGGGMGGNRARKGSGGGGGVGGGGAETVAEGAPPGDGGDVSSGCACRPQAGRAVATVMSFVCLPPAADISPPHRCCFRSATAVAGGAGVTGGGRGGGCPFAVLVHRRAMDARVGERDNDTALESLNFYQCLTGLAGGVGRDGGRLWWITRTGIAAPSSSCPLAALRCGCVA